MLRFVLGQSVRQQMTRKCTRSFAKNTSEWPQAENPAPSSDFQLKMEKSVNHVMLLGRVGNDPQLRGTEEHPVTVFTLATNSNFKQQSGDIQQKTEWHRISIFKPYLRDTVYKYLNKGQRVMVQGKISYGQITDAGGTIHTVTSIIADEVIFFQNTPMAETPR